MEKIEHKIENGVLVWITGLPGSGKTTLAIRVYDLIKDIYPSIKMDGDVFREIMGNDLGYNTEDRRANAFRLARMNKYLVEHGMVVICSTVSLIADIHKWNREHIKNIIEIFIEVPEEVLHRRDQKQMYSQGKAGIIDNVYGIHQSFDIPLSPELRVVNDGDLDHFLAHAEMINDLIISKINN